MVWTCRYYLKEAVSEGGTAFDKAYGMSMFQYLAQDANERSNTLFNQAMASHSVVITNKLLQFFRGFDDGAGVDVLVDVGGGTGATLRMITARHPHLRGVNYDLPHVIAQAPSAVEGLDRSSASYIYESASIVFLFLTRTSLCIFICRCGACWRQHV
jgi:hypothetical protein